MTQVSELKPCPFCGSVAYENQGGIFHPDENDCILAGLSWSASYYRKHWNTRAMKAAEPAGDVERVAEALANQIAMRKGCPPIKGCLALMPPEMAAIFRDDARAAIAAATPDGLALRLYEALAAFQRHVTRHSCTWDDSENASHHHPIWARVADTLEEARTALEGTPK